MVRGGLADPYDARDLTEVVFRVMRDLMTTETADHVEAELHEPAYTTEEKELQKLEIAELWRDTNPIVGFLSRVRPPWQGLVSSKLIAIASSSELLTKEDYHHPLTENALSKQYFLLPKKSFPKSAFKKLLAGFLVMSVNFGNRRS
jgi:Uncharacterized conserved protein